MEMQLKSAPDLKPDLKQDGGLISKSKRKENRDYVRDYTQKKKEEGYSRLAVFVPDEIREDVKLLVKQVTVRFEKESRQKHRECA